MKQLHPPLSLHTRALLFGQLATMDKAGLPLDLALMKLQLPGEARKRLVVFRRLLSRLIDPFTAGYKSGIFTPFEAQLLRVAMEAGSIEPACRRLAGRYTVRARQRSSMRTRMLLPLAILGIGLIVQPLPELARGTLGMGGYLWRVAGPLLALGAAFLAAGAIVRRLDGNGIFARRGAADFFADLGLLLQAGLPMFDALPLAVSTVPAERLRARFARILPAMRTGAPLDVAVGGIDVPDVDTACALIRTGELSGTLPEMLLRHADAQSEVVERFWRGATIALPALFYALVAAWMSVQLLAEKVGPVEAIG